MLLWSFWSFRSIPMIVSLVVLCQIIPKYPTLANIDHIQYQSASSNNGSHKFTLFNQCSYTIWPGIVSTMISRARSGTILPLNGGIMLVPNQSVTFEIESGWKGLIWPRTGCDALGRCDTGTCWNDDGQTSIHCRPSSKIKISTPVTMANFRLNGFHGKDWYEISVEHGYNVPMRIEPQYGTYEVDDDGSDGSGGDFLNHRCKPIVCTLVPHRHCPVELRQQGYLGGGSGGGGGASLDDINTADGTSTTTTAVSCATPCRLYGDERHCCTGPYYGLQYNCKPDQQWSIKTLAGTWLATIRDYCPSARAHRFDSSKLYSCSSGRGGNGKGGEYATEFMIRFC